MFFKGSRFRYKLGKIINRIIDIIASWFVAWRCPKPLRFWTEKEWKVFSPKKKIWIWYKHNWNLMNQGSGEIDHVLLFAKPENWYKLIAVAALFEAAWHIPWWVAVVLFIPLEVLNYILQWWIGEVKDRKDLIALEAEISNRRNMVYREIREKEEERLKNMKLLE